MRTFIHGELSMEAIGSYFSPQALEAIVAANLGQDHWLRGQIGHPEYHFDHDSFTRSRAYLEANRLVVGSALAAGDVSRAWRAFGRLIHAAQDFYAHSNYVSLWLKSLPEGGLPEPAAIDPLRADLLASPELRSGKVNIFLEVLCYVPGLQALVRPLMARDSHAKMNLDGPERGSLFPYAYQAALQRTRIEYRWVVQELPTASSDLFHGRPV